MLAAVAFLPAAATDWWHNNRNKFAVSLGVSLPVALFVLSTEPMLLLHSLKDYLSFVILLGALFVIAGGIFIRGAFAGTPLVNTVHLAAGPVLLNPAGTTGGVDSSDPAVP